MRKTVRNLLKAGGEVLAFFAVAAVPLFVVVAFTPQAWWQGLASIAVQSIGLAIGAGSACLVFVRLGRADLKMIGIRCTGENIRGFGVGLHVGVVMAAIAIGLAVLAGARITFTDEPITHYLRAVGEIGSVLLLAALAEELLFRGYPLSRISNVVGPVRASVAFGVLFMLGHAFNPEVTLFGLVNIGLAALVLSAVFFTRGLAAAWGLHVGWNGGLALGADSPVSGWEFQVPLVEYADSNYTWLTGGGFGPEGGLVSTIAMVGVLIWLIRTKNNTREDL